MVIYFMASQLQNDYEKIYLSQIYLNFRDKQVIFDLKNLNELHRTLMRAFPPEGINDQHGRKAFNLLYRTELLGLKVIEPDVSGIRRPFIYPKILIQSTIRPDWSQLPPGYLAEGKYLPENPVVKEVSLEKYYKAINEGSLFIFRILANPTKKIKDNEKKSKNSKRVPLLDMKEQISWLKRKGEQSGFKLRYIKKVENKPIIKAYKRKDNNKIKRSNNDGNKKQSKYMQITIQGVLFEGILEVIDPQTFIKSLINGIGPEKSYGFGLLSIAPYKQRY
ncbi:MAG: type I-E CRISPR-associated protein Cas6/Cse3/CasE [Promethearchaeota archaeon]